MNDFTGVSRECTKQRSVTIHDNEAKLLVGLEQLTQCLCVEFVVTEVERSVDGLEGLKVDIDLALLSLSGNDFTTVDDEAIGRDL